MPLDCISHAARLISSRNEPPMMFICEASCKRSADPSSRHKEWQRLDARAHNAHASHYCHNDHKHHDSCISRIPSFLYTPPLADPSKHLPGTSTRDGQFNAQHGVSEVWSASHARTRVAALVAATNYAAQSSQAVFLAAWPCCSSVQLAQKVRNAHMMLLAVAGTACSPSWDSVCTLVVRIIVDDIPIDKVWIIDNV